MVYYKYRTAFTRRITPVATNKLTLLLDDAALDEVHQMVLH